ncbi:MAG: DUF2249 domain-containing protein [Magnetococcus sp. DMHC-6]
MDKNCIPVVDLDVRDLEHPQPMLRILEATLSLQPGARLTVLHHRVPYLLYPRLAERGVQVETDERADGLVLLTLWRASDDD